ncbi:MAG: filamentous hemagglutinin N-terminal domain-containing protein [Phycisphaeraceae bacterium]|nr:filamentous hemagglutinin N-terminal domain-containing protein [Phycisphaeraceae bacterium]
MRHCVESRPTLRGCVVGVGLGRSVWVGAGVALLATSVTWAGPEGEKVVRGAAEFSRQGSLTRITAADKTIINYDRFDIGRNETVRFVQPSATSRVLNRVQSADPSRIDGTLQANGIVYFVNPAGVFFGNGALVDVGGIYAAAGNISNKDFLRGIDRFTSLTGSVVNEGRIEAAQGGLASLIGQNVVNAGMITADRGVIAMVAGDSVVLGERGGVLSVRVETNPANAGTPPAAGSVGVVNMGRVEARHGATRIVAGDMYSLAVKNTGVVRAGDIKVEAQRPAGRDTTVQVGGVLDARNGVRGGHGGAIQVVGDKIIVLDAKLDASGRNSGGTIHVGGGLQGGGEMPHAREAYVVNSSVRADAVKRGDGGEVVVFADEHLTFRSAASARAGELWGDGGIVETSAKGTVNISGARVEAHARSADGASGTWLMDPFDVSIEANPTSGGNFDGGDPDTFTPTATSVVDVADINTTLNTGTSVEILTGGPGGDPGTITLQAGATIDKTMGGDASLTLRAANDVVINGAIQSSSGALTVNLLANNGDNGNLDPDPTMGSVFVTGTGSIDTNGGALTIEGVDVFLNGAATIATGAGNVFLRPTDAASTIGVGAGAAGDFNVSAVELATITSTGTVSVGRSGGTGAVDLNAVDVSAGGYSLTVEGGSIVTESVTVDSGLAIRLLANAGDVDATGTPTLSANNGLVHIRADDINFDANVTISTGGGGTVEFVPNAGRTVSVATTGGDFNIGQDEVDGVTAGTLVIGSDDSGDMTVGAVDATGQADVLVLRSGGDVIATSDPTNATAATRVEIEAAGSIGSMSERFKIDAPEATLTTDDAMGSAFVQGIADTAWTLALAGDGDVLGDMATDVTGTVDGDLNVVSANMIVGTMLGVGGDATFETTNANQDISLSSTSVEGSVSFTTAGTGSVQMSSDDAIDLGASSIGGDLELVSGEAITDSGAVTVGGNAEFKTLNDDGGDIILDEDHAFAGTVRARVRNAADTDAADGEIDVRDADGFMDFAGGETEGTVTLRADDLDITGTLTAGDVNLRPLTAGTTIAVNDAAGSMDISTADLANIDSAGTVEIGSANAGEINVGSMGTTDLSGEGYSLTLHSGADVVLTDTIILSNNSILGLIGDNIDGSSLATDVQIGGTGGVFVIATGDVNLDTDVSRIAIDSGGAIDLENAGALSITTVGSVVGVSAGSDADIDITAASISVDADVTAMGIGSVTLRADDGDMGDIAVNATVASDTGDIRLWADNDIDFATTGVVRSSSGGIELVADFDMMNSGGDGTGGAIAFDAGARVVTDGTITASADGDIDDLSDAGMNGADPIFAAPLVNITSAFGTIGGTTSVDTAATAIVASAPGGIHIANTGDLTATLNSTSGAVSLTNDGTLITGADWTASAFDVSATGDFEIAHDVTASGGDNVFTSSGGMLTVNGGRSITSTGGDITIEALDLDLDGSLDAGMDRIFVRRSAAGTMGLGLATGDMTIDNNELERMTASRAVFGDMLETSIAVNGVTGGAVANLPEVVINAIGDGGSIVFQGIASNFRALEANADDGISVNVGISVTEGDLVLNADFDDAADSNDMLSIASGVTLSSQPGGGSIVLRATSGGIEGAGSLTVNSANDIDLDSDLNLSGTLTMNAGGAITLQGVAAEQLVTLNADNGVNLNGSLVNSGSATFINADADGDGMGSLSVAMGFGIETNGNDLTITAADLILDGSIDAGTGTVSIRRADTGSIGLGTAMGDMTVDADELSRITASTLRFGNSFTDQMNIAGVTASSTAGISSLLELITDDIDISGQLNTSMADLVITRANIGSIGVGTAMGDMMISGAELAMITTPELTIGGGQTTDVNVSGVTAMQSMGIGAVRLEAGERIVFGGGSNTFRALTALARDGMTVNANLTTTEGNLLLNGNSDNDNDVNDKITIADGRTISAGSVLTLEATAAGIEAAGDLTLNAVSDININSTLSTMGTLVVNADSTGSGQGRVVIPSGTTVISNGNPITFTGSNFVLNGNVNAGAGSVAIRRSSLGTITLGTGTQGMLISGVELSRIIATGLTIGGVNTGIMIVNGINALNSNNIVGITRLEALGGAGAISFNGTASTFNALEVLANNVINVNVSVNTDTGSLRFNADANSTPDGRDAVRLAANVSAPATQDLIFDSDVTIRAQAVGVSGRNVTFNGRVDSDSGLRDLAVSTSNGGVTAFNGDVGTIRRLRNLTTNADGSTRIGGEINARNGAITFNDFVRLTGDATIRTDGGTGVFFNGAVDSQGNTNRRLTVVVDTDAAADLNALPIISFTNDVGAAFPLGEINLNFDPGSMIDGHVNIPRVATIVARPRNNAGQVIASPGAYSITFNTSGAFNMGVNEKLTALGNLTINAVTARLGDLSTLGNMTVNAGSIGLLVRPAGAILSNMGTFTAFDQGLDLVSGGNIAFSVVPTVIGSGPLVSFATQSGSGDVNSTLSTFLFRAFGTIDVAQFNNGTTNIVTLDLRSSGPTNTNFSDAIAGAIPRETRLNDVGQQVAIGSAQMEDLKNLGIVPRGPTPQELLDFLIGQTIYNDVPSRMSPRPDDYTTVVNRLPSERVQALLDDYDRVFNIDLLDDAGNPVINPRTGRAQRVSRTDEIRSTLLGSVRRYRAENPDATGELHPFQFRAFIDASPEEARSAGYLNELAEFLDVLETIGLTPRELVTSKNILLKDVRPAGVGSVANFETVIRAGDRSRRGEVISAR